MKEYTEEDLINLVILYQHCLDMRDMYREREWSAYVLQWQQAADRIAVELTESGATISEGGIVHWPCPTVVGTEETHG